MILVDSSVWIDFFSSSSSVAGHELRRMIVGAEPVALTGLIVAEVLQGLTRDVTRIEGYLSMWDIVEPRLSTYSDAAAIFRLARAKGLSLTTIDTIIAAIAIENRAALFTLDQDFVRISRITNLQLYQPA